MKRPIVALAMLALLDAAPAADLPVAVERWRPRPDLRWQVQYSATPVDLTVDADVFKIDLFDSSAAVVSALKDRGRKVVCYLNAGAWEAWRPDAKRFPAVTLGKDYVGWPGERWLDIRRIELLAPIMRARLDACRDKRFDGVLLDNVDGYTNATGFALSAEDQLRYNVWLANEARARGLAVGVNNDPEQASQLSPHFDWAQAESCLTQGWCGKLRPFVDAGKPVVVIEYIHDRPDLESLCKRAAALQVSLIVKRRELDALRRDCIARADPKRSDGGARQKGTASSFP